MMFSQHLKYLKWPKKKEKNKMLNNGGWECVCGKTNPAYTGTCCCGRTKTEVLDLKKQEKEKERSETILKDEALKLDNLKKMKELLDDSVITRDEFDAKKKKLLEI